MSRRSIYPRTMAESQARNVYNKWKKKMAKSSKGFFAWRFLKGIIFIFCLTFFVYQSTGFLLLYYEYPTTTKIEFIYPDEIEAPAVTYCHANPIKRSKFCEEYPNLCEIPENIKEFCENNPFMCKDNTSNPALPKLGSLDSYLKAMSTINAIFCGGNITRDFFEEWTWSIGDWMMPHKTMKPVFLLEDGFYRPCYSENILLNSSNEPVKIHIENTDADKKNPMEGNIFIHILNLNRSEEILPTREPVVFFSIHSPFEPINPFYQGMHLKLGFRYNIFIRQEEQRLLKHPYESNCTDYKDLWIKRNRQGPRSQKMCKEFCWHDLYEMNKEIKPEFKMLEYPFEVCLGQNCSYSSEERKLLDQCKKDCKASCRVLKYNIIRIDSEPDFSMNTEGDIFREDVVVYIYLGDHQVVVERHNPVYETAHLFSYIGGLMGCWLGVSIWAFAGIAEKVFRRYHQWIEKIKGNLKNKTLISFKERNPAFN